MSSLIRKPYPYTYKNASLILIGINLAVFFVTMLLPRSSLYLGLHPLLFLKNTFLWQPLTYMFVHGNLNHLVLNMLGLFFFAPQVEERMGTWEFLSFYLIIGILAGLLSVAVYWFSGMYQVLLVGASGAIFAVLLAFAVYFPNNMVYLFGLLPLRAVTMVIGFTVIEVVSSIFSLRSGVAHLTHLAGFVLAFLYFPIRLGMNPVQVFRDARNNPWS